MLTHSTAVLLPQTEFKDMGLAPSSFPTTDPDFISHHASATLTAKQLESSQLEVCDMHGFFLIPVYLLFVFLNTCVCFFLSTFVFFFFFKIRVCVFYFKAWGMWHVWFFLQIMCVRVYFTAWGMWCEFVCECMCVSNFTGFVACDVYICQ